MIFNYKSNFIKHENRTYRKVIPLLQMVQNRLMGVAYLSSMLWICLGFLILLHIRISVSYSADFKW